MSQHVFDAHGKSLEARQALLDNRAEHKPKRHRTIGRRRRLAAAKKRRIEHANAERKTIFKRFKSKVRAYWAGDVAGYPTKPEI